MDQRGEARRGTVITTHGVLAPQEGGSDEEGLVAGRGFKCRTCWWPLPAGFVQKEKGEVKFRHLGNKGNQSRGAVEGAERRANRLVWLREKKRVTQQVPGVHVDPASWSG